MVMEVLQDGFESELQKLSKPIVKKSLFFDENSEKRPFIWRKEQSVTAQGNETASAGVWAREVASMNFLIRDEVRHFSLRLDLLNLISRETANYKNKIISQFFIQSVSAPSLTDSM